MRILINHPNLWKSGLNACIAIQHILVRSNLCSLVPSRGSLSCSQDGLFHFCEERSSSQQGLQTCHFFFVWYTVPFLPSISPPRNKSKKSALSKYFNTTLFFYPLSQFVNIYLLVQFLKYLQARSCLFCSLALSPVFSTVSAPQKGNIQLKHPFSCLNLPQAYLLGFFSSNYADCIIKLRF